MTNNEAISAVLEGVNRSTDDFPVSRRFVYRELINSRSELIKQELNKRRLINDTSAQTLDCIVLERVDASTCSDCPTGIYILKSDRKIPELIESDFGPAIINFYLGNGTAVSPLSFEDWQARKTRRNQLPGHFGYAFRNQRLFVLDYDDVDELRGSLVGHFVRPEEIIALNKDSEDCPASMKCKPIGDYDFYCPGHIVRRVIEIARSVVLRKLGIPSDESNNAKFDINAKGNQGGNAD